MLFLVGAIFQRPECKYFLVPIGDRVRNQISQAFQLVPRPKEDLTIGDRPKRIAPTLEELTIWSDKKKVPMVNMNESSMLTFG